MLRQILSEMYIDPDLLAELSEEQKQILFFKMREEQIRRWKEREAAMERKASLPVKSRPKKENGKSVHWKLGADKEVWVWVMGEHHLDKPYDVLCDEILAERERLRATVDSGLRKAQSGEFTHSLKTESQNCDLQAPKKQETQSVCEKGASEEESRQGSRTAPIQSKHETQKEPTKQKHDEEIKQIDDDKTKQIYKSWKEDSEWQASLPELNPTEEEQGRQRWQYRLEKGLESSTDINKENATARSSLESVRKSKAADEKRRSLAKQAREDYKRLSQRGRSGEVLQNPLTAPQKPRRPPLPPKPQFLHLAGHPPKSLGNQGVTRTASGSAQEDIIRWFKEEQLPFRAGYQKNSDTIAPWFHGILTLKKANELLSTGMPGSFLIRVSEKIKGYALSYRSEEGCKHFLIDASTDSYSFLGVDQLQHATLSDLVEYHKEEPITSLGKELLLYPCGQQDKPPDYLELFE